ncbi:MAG: hypothetical protein H6Q73_199 [Firmicutes bacterium]|nr:hypothetical protein [Bacillota bacterium]
MLYIMQNSFTGGEFAPSMDSRQDVQKYGTGCKTMKNFYVKPQGSAVNRPGTVFVAETKDSGEAYLIPFSFNESIAYMLEFGDYYVRFYRDSGQLVLSSADAWAASTAYAVNDYVEVNSLIYRCTTAHTSTSDDEPGTGTNWATYWVQSAIYQITSPYPIADVPDLKFTQSADVMYLAHADYAPRTLTRSGDTRWAIALFAFTLGPFAPMNLTDTTITPSGTLTVDGEITLSASDDVFTSNHVGALFRLDQDIEAQCLSGKFTSSGVCSSNKTDTLSSSHTHSSYTITYTMTVSGTYSGGTVTLYYSTDNSSFSSVLSETANGEFEYSVATTRGYAYATISDLESGSCSVTLKQSYYGGTSSVSVSSGANGGVTGMGTWMLTTHGTWTGVLYLEKSEDGGESWKKLRQYSCATDNIADSGTEDDEIVMLRVRMYSWDSTDSDDVCRFDLQFEPYTSYGICEITAVTSTTEATATVKQQFGSTDATEYWYQGAWSEERGWPSAVVFYQNRLVFGATESEPQTLWTSNSGDYTNFGVSATVEDDDAITTPLVNDKVNAIKSLKALSKIIGLTAGGYWVIGAGDSTAFTPSSQNASAEGYFGASSLEPVIIGNRILFTSCKGAIVRDMGYDYSAESYIAVDLTLYAEHLFKNRTIKQWAYAQEPDGIVWCIGSDGTLLGLTYLKEQQVCGWHRHETDGTYESVAVIPGDDRDQVWFIVNRTINGETKRYVEVMAARVTDAATSTNSDGEEVVVYDPADQYFVDCGLSYSSDTAVSTISGLDHLEGKTVSILADGNVHPQKTVTDGAITLDYSASVVHVGLPYTCDLETLNIEFQAQDGTIQTRYKTITKATIRFENSRGAFVGTSFSKLYELKMRSTEAYGVPIALYTGDKEIQFNSAPSVKGRICIRMSDPLPIAVAAIVTEVTLDG